MAVLKQQREVMNMARRAIAWSIIAISVAVSLQVPSICAKPNQKSLDAALLAALENNNVKRFKSLLAQGTSVNARDKNGRTALMNASFVGDPEEELLRVHPLIFLKLLLAHGANVNLRDKDGETALMTAVQGSVEAVKLLIAKGAQVNAKNNRGETALMRAIEWECEGSCSSPDVVKYLLSHGADVNAADKEGNTALIWAARLPNYTRADAIAITKMLIAKGADVNARTKNGNTALKWAKMNNHAGIVRVLKRVGARA